MAINTTDVKTGTIAEILSSINSNFNACKTGFSGVDSALGGKLASTANAVSASKWATARTITFTGAITGSASMDGSSNVTLATTLGSVPAANITGVPLTHGAGLFNFSVTNGTAVAWKLASGAVSYSTSQNLTLPAGTSYLYCNNLWASGVQVSAGSTGSNFTGDLSSLSNLTYFLSLYNCSLVTGSLSSLNNLTNYLNLGNCSLVTGDLSSIGNLTNSLRLDGCSLVTGNLSSVSNLTYLLSLDGCSLVTGNLSSVSNLTNSLNLNGCALVTGNLSSIGNLINSLSLSGCSLVTGNLSSLSNLTNSLSLNGCSLVTGVLSPKATLSYIDISYTGVSSTDLDTSISNLNTITTVTSGKLKLSGLTRSSASTMAINALITKGWTVTDAKVVG